MANRLYNKQVTPKGYKMGGRVKKMGGGMMKRKENLKRTNYVVIGNKTSRFCWK